MAPPNQTNVPSEDQEKASPAVPLLGPAWWFALPLKPDNSEDTNKGTKG